MAMTKEEYEEAVKYHEQLLVETVILGMEPATSPVFKQYVEKHNQLEEWYGIRKAAEKIAETKELLRITGVIPGKDLD